MSELDRAPLKSLQTGVPGLDLILGGGLPEYSFNLIAGTPGSGKTTLAQQVVFANASPDCAALYFTVLGEPPLKILRYQQQFSFFSEAKLAHIRFINLTQEALKCGFGAVLERIVHEVEATQPGIVVVDSFRSIVRRASNQPSSSIDLEELVQRLALQLTAWQATTFLVGEYRENEVPDNPVFTVADGILSLSQNVERNSIVRQLQVLKLRGQASQPGLHTFRITSGGLEIFPRSFGTNNRPPRARPLPRASTGVSPLDEMLDGGIPVSDSAVVAGPSGSGKTMLCTQFIHAGGRRGEPGVICLFDEHPDEYAARADALGFEIGKLARRGLVEFVYLRPLDLSVDETLRTIGEATKRVGAKRLVIDSLSGFELALAPAFRPDFQESLYRMVGVFTGMGITVLSAVEVTTSYDELRFSPGEISFLADDIILLRYVEWKGKLRKVITVVKMRSCCHSQDFRLYDTTPDGLAIRESLEAYHGILSGVLLPGPPGPRGALSGLTPDEMRVLDALLQSAPATYEELRQRLDQSPAQLKSGLARLLALDYVARGTAAGRTLYRPTGVPE